MLKWIFNMPMYRLWPQMKKRYAKHRARGGDGRAQHMLDLQRNEEKIRVVQEAMRRARDIAEAETAQRTVWQQMHEREAMRQEILQKAREKKQRLEAELEVFLAMLCRIIDPHVIFLQMSLYNAGKAFGR